MAWKENSGEDPFLLACRASDEAEVQLYQSWPLSLMERRAFVLGTGVNKLWSEKLTVPGDWGSGM